MRAKSVARKLANSININTDNDNGNDNGNGNVNIGTSLAYKGKSLELQRNYSTCTMELSPLTLFWQVNAN